MVMPQPQHAADGDGLPKAIEARWGHQFDPPFRLSNSYDHESRRA
jgi:hypothetical protein